MMVSMMMGAALQYLSNPDAFNLNHYMKYCLDTVIRTLTYDAETDVHRPVVMIAMEILHPAKLSL